MTRDFVTPEQIAKAREVKLLDFLYKSEPDNLIRSAPGEYGLKDHDSLKISNGKFNWFSRGIGGTNAIDFLVKVRGREFQEAVRELAGDYMESHSKQHSTSKPTWEKQPASERQNQPANKPAHTPNKQEQSASKPEQTENESANFANKPAQPAQNSNDGKRPTEGRVFSLPRANGHNEDAIDYLLGRGIDESVIIKCINKNLLYQSMNNSCVFVGHDGRNVPKFACERGMASDYKKDVAGSNKAFSFSMPPIAEPESNPQARERLYVFEGAVDCLSHASIAQMGGVDWDGHRLSLGGVSSLALNAFLERSPEIRHVYVCLDNDGPGKDAAERICMELLANERYGHISVHVAPPPDVAGKDFNDALAYIRGKMREKEKPLPHGRTDEKIPAGANNANTSARRLRAAL